MFELCAPVIEQLTCRQLRLQVGATAMDLPGLVQRQVCDFAFYFLSSLFLSAICCSLRICSLFPQEIRMLSVGKGLASISFSSRCVPHTLPPPHFVIALCPPSSVAPSLQSIHCAHETHRLHKQAILHTVSRPFTGVVASKQRLGKLCGASSCHSGESCARLAWSPRARSLPETGVCVRMCLGERAGESESERASEREVTNVCVCVLQGRLDVG